MSSRALTDNDLASSADVRQLQEAVAHYQRVLSGAGYGFWEWDLEKQHIHWLGDFWVQLGYGEEDAPRLQDPNYMPEYIHPDDREPVLEAVRQHLRTREPLNVAYRIRKADGEYVWNQLRADSRPNAQGRVRYISGVNFDITELKKTEDALRESEARQKRIIQASNDGIWEWYAEQGGFHFSARCWEHIGYTEADDVLNEGVDRLQVWRSRIHPDDLPRFDQVLAAHMKTEEPFDIEYRIYGKDNSVYWIRARGRATLSQDGRALRMSGTNMDITHLKHAEEKVVKAKEQAEKANRAKSEFLSSMSHELRTPLNAILGYAQLFGYDGNLSLNQQENLKEIRSAGEHLLQLINDVLDLARIESGKLTISLEPVLVSRVVEECMTLMQTEADKYGIRLCVSLNDLGEAYVMADNVRLKQALMNLVSNGIKYNRIGGRVEVVVTQPDTARVCISVVDDGFGIPKDYQSKVFEPFNRLKAEFSKVEGSGVGLVITKQLVEIMLGSLDFTSIEGQGSNFTIDLPSVDGSHQDLMSESRSGRQDKSSIGELVVRESSRVLYVEDNRSNIRLMEQFFSRYPQLQLDIAEEAFLGIYKARSTLPDMIILDINLPGMDGFEALSVLKQDPATAGIPVVGLSANAMPHDVQRGRDSGFEDYLTKPLDINQMIGVLNRLLPPDA